MAYPARKSVPEKHLTKEVVKELDKQMIPLHSLTKDLNANHPIVVPEVIDYYDPTIRHGHYWAWTSKSVWGSISPAELVERLVQFRAAQAAAEQEGTWCTDKREELVSLWSNRVRYLGNTFRNGEAGKRLRAAGVMLALARPA